MTGTCQCGEVFIHKSATQKYCSGKCADEAHGKRPPRRTTGQILNCPHCRADFTQSNPRQVFCSKTCKGYAAKKRSADKKPKKWIRGTGPRVVRVEGFSVSLEKFPVPPPKKRECENCGAEFYPIISTQRRCSNTCLPVTKCRNCKEDFRPKNRREICCSTYCANALDMSRKHKLAGRLLESSLRNVKIVLGDVVGCRRVVAMEFRLGKNSLEQIWVRMECICGRLSWMRLRNLSTRVARGFGYECQSCSGVKSGLKRQYPTMSDEEIQTLLVGKLESLTVSKTAKAVEGYHAET